MRVEKLAVRGRDPASALVLSPHPDDEAIGCGGTLIKLVEAGCRVTVVQLTDGSGTSALRDCPDSIRKSIRLEEARRAAAILGLRDLILSYRGSSELRNMADSVNQIVNLLERLNPWYIFVPFVNDPHEDHVFANRLLRTSLEAAQKRVLRARVLSYEVWSIVPANRICVINEQIERKIEALMAYNTAMKVVDYVHYCRSLNSYHARTLLGKGGFAEAFLDLEAQSYISMADKVLGR